VRFTAAHDKFWFPVRRNNQVDVIGANVQGEQFPAAEMAFLDDGIPYDNAAWFIEVVWLLGHPLPILGSSIGIRRQPGSARFVVLAIN
jgi:hypothetical protein